MSLLYTNNRDDDIVNMIAADVSLGLNLRAIAAKYHSKFHF